MKKTKKFKIGLLCGGPSLERGISLNSARSVMDHLQSENIEVFPIYFNNKKESYKILKVNIYSNTPSDFDFKLKGSSKNLKEKELVRFLKSMDIIFSAIHGTFGEDGKIQKFLEKNKIPFVGSGSNACKKAFDKFDANNFINSQGFFTLPSTVLKIYHKNHKEIVKEFFEKNKIKRAVVKPASGGSSIGVFSVSNINEALEKAKILFSKRMDTRVVIEPFAEGIEFTMIILENEFGLPVALPPTEIETDYTENQIFDFRRKYLPTRQVTWHCPPRFNKNVIEKIQARGEQIFKLFRMHDFGRFDGWVLPDGNIWFCDFNPISGMEQNSFLFQQASQIGMTHRDVLTYIVRRSCERQGISFPSPSNIEKRGRKKKKVGIIMGGYNSEKQVSLMSGTNVWLKLRSSEKYDPQPYLLDPEENIWKLPYHLCLNHTVEEIAENCKKHKQIKSNLFDFERRARLRIGLSEEKDETDFYDPQKISFEDFANDSDFIFIALHGGEGENGTLQKKLKLKGVKFNGSDEKVSFVCMNKSVTAEVITDLQIKGVDAIPGKTLETEKFFCFTGSDIKDFWKKTKKELRANTLIVKPCADGCTTGIVHLFSSDDLKKYAQLLKKNISFIPKGTFKGQTDIIEMPVVKPPHLLFEKFIETDAICVKGNKLNYRRKTDWIEITVGVLEKDGRVKSLNPSITIVEGEVLTVEEKFQGGTGVNITPPPKEIVKKKIIERVKRKVEELSLKIGIRGYSRIDTFLNVKNGNLLVIEINTLPGLTPSTVLYHQGLAEEPPIFPKELIEMLIENKSF